MFHFLPKSADREKSFFQYLKKSVKFQWTEERETLFQELKTFLAAPPILSRPELGEELSLYLFVTVNALSIVLVREEDKTQRLIYFISKTFQGAELRYQKIKKLALVLVTVA